MTETDVQLVIDATNRLLGTDRTTWVEPSGFPDSLALCIIDSAFSLRAHYSGVISVRRRYTDVRCAAGADPEKDGVLELIRAIEQAGGAEEAAVELFGSRAKAPGTNRLKSAVVHDAAVALDGVGIRTTEQLRETSKDPLRQDEVKKAWLGVSGLGPASWRYVLMLAGTDGTKPDIMIRRFVTAALGAEELVPAERARVAIEGAAAHLGVRTFVLDHTVWRYQSGRWAGPGEIFVAN